MTPTWGTRYIAATMLVLFAAAGAVNLALSSHARAANDSLNIITSPLPISLVAKPGTSVSTDLKVKNGGANPEKLKVTLLKFGAYGEEGKPKIEDFTATDRHANWVTFSEKTFTAEPSVWKTIKMTVNVPKDAAFGYYYAAVFSRAVDVKANDPRENTLAGSVATLVLLEAQVPGAKRQVDVVGFKSKKMVYEFLPAEFEIKLRNSGNVHVAPRGNIFISKGKKSIGTVEVNQEQGNVLPNSNRIFESKWEDGFPVYVDKVVDGKVVTDKRANPVRHLKWDLNNLGKFRFGKYTATATLVYDDGKRDVPVEAAVSFWVIPWRWILVMTLIAAVVAAGLYTIVRSAVGGGRRRRR